MTVVDVISLALIVLALADWFATMILVRAARSLREPALAERAGTSVVLSIGASGAAILGIAQLLRVQHGAALWLLTVGLVALSLPQLIWCIAYFTGRFR